MIECKDNLEFMSQLQSESIDLIYCDISKPKKSEGNINLKTKIQMENFFIDEDFCGDLSDLMDDRKLTYRCCYK